MNSGESKSWSGPLVDEVRQAWEHYAATFDYTLQAFFYHLISQEKNSDRMFATYPARTTSPTELTS